MYARHKDNLKNEMITVIRASKNDNQEEVFKKMDAAYKAFKHIGRKAADPEGRTPLIIATQESNKWAVEWLLKRNPLIHHTDNKKKSALLYSICYEDKVILSDHKLEEKNKISIRRDITKMLIEKSSALGDFNFYQETKKYIEQNVLFQASKNKNYYFLDYFFKLEKVDTWVWGLHCEFFEKLFIWGIENKDIELLKCLHEIELSDQRYKIQNNSFLKVAFYHNKLEVAEWLIATKCCVFQDSFYDGNKNVTPLEKAAELGNLKLIRLILDNIKTRQDNSNAILLAINNGHIEAIKLLLEKSEINKPIDVKLIKFNQSISQINSTRISNYLQAMYFIWNNHELDAKVKAKKLLTEMNSSDRDHLLKIAEQYKYPRLIINELKSYVSSLTDILRTDQISEFVNTSGSSDFEFDLLSNYSNTLSLSPKFFSPRATTSIIMPSENRTTPELKR